MPKSKPRKPTVNCGGCGAPIAPAGRPPKNGTWFCMRPPCRAAKQREYREIIRAQFGAESGIEDRPCSNCGEHMLSRRKRVDDMPEGRWCTRTKCQLAKQRFRSQMRSATPEQMMHINTQAFMKARREQPRVTCEGCGFDDAIPGFPHPTPECSPEQPASCNHLGALVYDMNEAVWTWPHKLTRNPKDFEYAASKAERYTAPLD